MLTSQYELHHDIHLPTMGLVCDKVWWTTGGYNAKQLEG
jgi:hypothetical protein